MRLKVAIWDDRGEELRASQEKLRTIFDEEPFKNDFELLEVETDLIITYIDALTRAHEQLADGMDSVDSSGGAELDAIGKIDVVCIDYDLRALQAHAWLTADSLAGLVRALTDCPFVVVLNRPPRRAFDLTMLSGWNGPGDLQVPQSSIFLRSFWLSRATRGDELTFRPWSWPDLKSARARLESRINELAPLTLSEVDIFEFFGFDSGLVSRFSQRALGSLSGVVALNNPRLTFKDFLLTGAKALLPDTLAKIAHAADGLAHRVALRTIAFDLGRWCSEQLLAGQDVLVDTPHLVSRAPWLLGESIRDLGCWNSKIEPANQLCDLNPWLSGHVFPKKDWVDRTAYVWPKTQASQELAELSAKFRGDVPDFVFLEDSSCFARIENSEDYSASFGNVWDRRYVSNKHSQSPGIQYGPIARYAL